MMRPEPTILRHYDSVRCVFSTPLSSDETLNPAHYLIPSLSWVATPDVHASDWMGHVAVHKDDKWSIIEARLFHLAGQLSVYCSERNVDSMAFPIDPGQTRESIEGAIGDPVKNAAGDAWLFYHGSAAPHHKHLLDVHKAIVARFQTQLNKIDLKWKQAIADGVSATAATLLTKHENLLAYCDDVLAEADRRERLHPHGHFVRNPHPTVDHVHRAILSAMTATKAKWAVTPQQLAKYRTIRDEAVAITRELATPHDPETLWARKARLEREKKAAEAEQENAQ